jgi:carbamoyltransferase
MNLVEEDTFDLDAGQSHDSAAVLIHDGEVVAGIEQERLDRIKHSNKFPIDAIRFCLEAYRVTPHDVDAFVYYTSKQTMDARLRQNALKWNVRGAATTGRRHFTEAADFFSHLLTTGLGSTVSAERIQFVRHHVAHLVSAFACSGWDEALLLSIDAVGEGESGRVAIGRGGSIETLKRFGASVSLGHLYTLAIRHLGFRMFDEYKAMGLAPYGDPARFRRELAGCYKLLPRGDYATNPGRLFDLIDVVELRPKGTEFTQTHMDLAAAIQEALETVVFHVLRHYRESTGLNNLCLAGGVAHNCTMNGKIAASGLFDRVYVQPAAHDAGCALGAALSAYYRHRDSEDLSSSRAASDFRAVVSTGGVAHRASDPSGAVAAAVEPIVAPAGRAAAAFTHLYWGTDIGGGDEIRAALDRWREWIEFERVDEVERRGAELIASGSVIGWVQGRSEFGPRALGNRSILADPRPAENKWIINAMVKKREGFRPFAPSVLEEFAHDYFILPAADSPFMIFVMDVRKDRRTQLGAITHIDGTARVQTVSRRTNPRYWALLNEFRALTGIPLVLNTSFNNNAEPIVDSTDDAVVCFLTTGLHALIVGEYVVRKKQVMPSALRRLVVTVPRHLRMVHVVRQEQSRRVAEHVIVSNTDSTFEQRLSQTAFDVLQRADGRWSVDELLSVAGVPDGPPAEALLGEIAELWAQRVVALAPRVTTV